MNNNTKRRKGKVVNCCICNMEVYKAHCQLIKVKDKRYTCSSKCGNEKKSLVQLEKVEEKLGVDSFKDWLEQKYHVEQLNTRDIAEIVYGKRTHGPNIAGWMERLGVDVRSRSDAISLQWKDNDDRRRQAAREAVKNMGEGTPSRKKLIKAMQSEEYKEKQRVSKTGEKNGMWSPNLSDEEREKQRYHSRRYEGYQDFRRKVFERDKYTCQKCLDDTGGNLVAHHLNGFHWDIKSRTEVDNGVTLCNDCHNEFHSIYGNRNNNLFQFSQFMDLTSIK